MNPERRPPARRVWNGQPNDAGLEAGGSQFRRSRSPHRQPGLAFATELGYRLEPMPSLFLRLDISPDDLLDYYRGLARTVQARASNGQTVNFPASALQRHVTKEGVHGDFRLEFDEHHKFVRLEPVKNPPGFDQTA
jgi:hypothetical protein